MRFLLQKGQGLGGVQVQLVADSSAILESLFFGKSEQEGQSRSGGGGGLRGSRRVSLRNSVGLPQLDYCGCERVEMETRLLIPSGREAQWNLPKR